MLEQWSWIRLNLRCLGSKEVGRRRMALGGALRLLIVLVYVSAVRVDAVPLRAGELVGIELRLP